MLLERLVVCNFGVFGSIRTFELAPRTKYGAIRPIILFGGLNGAGKTTILTAVRTVLYGRQSLGFGASQKAYEIFLEQLIHKKKDALIPHNAASVTLEFSYSQLGRQSRYAVTRSWAKNGKRLEESLRIKRDGVSLDDLTADQAQAFLNQLIPIGVSELFFFDGEKIASLASDSGEAALSSSIRRLLGLDVLDKLRADLTIYARQKRGSSLNESQTLELASLQQQLDTLKREGDDTLALLREEVAPAIDRTVQELDYLEGVFKNAGGAWAVSREAISTRVDALALDKEEVSTQIRELLSGAYPICLATTVADDVVRQLVIEQTTSQRVGLREGINQTVDALRQEFRGALSATAFRKVEPILAKYVQPHGEDDRDADVHRTHNLGDIDAATVIETLKFKAPEAAEHVQRLRGLLESQEQELVQLAERLAQAPVEERLADELGRMKSKSEELGQLRARKQHLLEIARSKLWAAIDINRQLRRLEEKVVHAQSSFAALERAGSTIDLLDDFSAVLTKRKVEVLRQHFTTVFSRLARKEDLVVDASIDCDTFEVILTGKNGERIPKESLSAGEKQVYAIAMLEALAKTSGRSLPIIIDTPLGRLDSVHRRKLVDHYFPKASHQVIILSTDTEVDQEFYETLGPSVSHAFHLKFDEVEGMTKVEGGYFWRRDEQVMKYAS